MRWHPVLASASASSQHQQQQEEAGCELPLFRAAIQIGLSGANVISVLDGLLFTDSLNILGYKRRYSLTIGLVVTRQTVCP